MYEIGWIMAAGAKKQALKKNRAIMGYFGI
jgi:hypothetical protein